MCPIQTTWTDTALQRISQKLLFQNRSFSKPNQLNFVPNLPNHIDFVVKLSQLRMQFPCWVQKLDVVMETSLCKGVGTIDFLWHGQLESHFVHFICLWWDIQECEPGVQLDKHSSSRGSSEEAMGSYFLLPFIKTCTSISNGNECTSVKVFLQ